MVDALHGVRSCGRCGEELGERDAYCPACGVLRVSAASGSALGSYSGLLTGVRPAAGGRRRFADALDVLLALPLVVALVLVAIDLPAFPDGVRLALLPALVVALAILIAVQLACLAARGRTFGRLVLGLRTVDDLSGEPVRLVDGVRPVSLRRRTVTADLRRGRDPLARAVPLLAELAPPEEEKSPRTTPIAIVLPGAVRPGAGSPSVTLVLDSGERLDVERTLLIGRLPTNGDGEDHPLFAWPDLSRSMSKTHALLEWTGTVLRVTDRGSTNGTSLTAPDGTIQPLAAGLPGSAAPGWTVHLGDRSLEVHPSGVLAPLGAGNPGAEQQEMRDGG